jgi:hypothetical protein
MGEKINLTRTVLNRENLLSAIDNRFTTFAPPSPTPTVDRIEEFFKQYDELYLEIPVEGENNSHQYLIEQSSKIYQIGNRLAEIQPLLDEIAQLRRQLLETQQENVNLRLNQARNV